MSQEEEGGEGGGGNEVYLGLPCGRQKILLAILNALRESESTRKLKTSCFDLFNILPVLMQ